MSPDDGRYEIDQELYKAVPYGGYSKLARHRNVKVNNISKYYDPHDTDYQSIFSRALLELRVIARVCPEWARNITSAFRNYTLAWCGAEGRRQSKAEVSAALNDFLSLKARYEDGRASATEVEEAQHRALEALAGYHVGLEEVRKAS